MTKYGNGSNNKKQRNFGHNVRERQLNQASATYATHELFVLKTTLAACSQTIGRNMVISTSMYWRLSGAIAPLITANCCTTVMHTKY
jgi:hypothetical protein